MVHSHCKVTNMAQAKRQLNKISLIVIFWTVLSVLSISIAGRTSLAQTSEFGSGGALGDLLQQLQSLKETGAIDALEGSAPAANLNKTREKGTVIIQRLQEESKQTGKIEDWGGAFKIRDFFRACNAPDNMDDNGMPVASMLSACEDKTVLLLTYPNKKGGRSTWNCVTYATRDKDKFKDFFLKGALNTDEKRRYPKNYQSPDTDPQPVSAEMQKAIDSSELNTDML